MHPEVFLALDEALKKNCYDLFPELTPHDNVGFWKGFAYAVRVMKEAYPKYEMKEVDEDIRKITDREFFNLL